MKKPPPNLLSFHQHEVPEAGVDEAGRGCLAGPVVAAAVVLPQDFSLPGLNDSKQLGRTARNKLRLAIEEQALAWAVASASPEEIDAVNILQATYLAMHRAIAALDIHLGLLLVDGNRFAPYEGIEHRCIIGGDAQCAAIAAASVLAKTHRDELMQTLHAQYPHYGWQHNNAYPTLVHQRALAEHGPCEHHRRSFRLDYQG